MKNSYIYQVSTEDQAKEGYSLDVQREYLESFAKRGSLEYLSGRPYIGLNAEGQPLTRSASGLSASRRNVGLTESTGCDG